MGPKGGGVGGERARRAGQSETNTKNIWESYLETQAAIYKLPV